MFDFLLTRYFSAEQKASSKNVEDFRTRLMVLRLLLENFQEHFSSKSLLAHLFGQSKRPKRNRVTTPSDGEHLKWSLSTWVKIQRPQLISLAPVSVTIKDVYVPLNKVIDPTPETNRRGPLQPAASVSPFIVGKGWTGENLSLKTPSTPGCPVMKVATGRLFAIPSYYRSKT